MVATFKNMYKNECDYPIGPAMNLPAAEEAAVAMMPEEPGFLSAEPHDVAAYIAAITEELTMLAESRGFDTLGYILDMARMEADQIAKGFGQADDEAT
jgi:hypothetical protein